MSTLTGNDDIERIANLTAETAESLNAAIAMAVMVNNDWRDGKPNPTPINDHAEFLIHALTKAISHASELRMLQRFEGVLP